MTTFTDKPLGIHWEDNSLYDDMYAVGHVVRTLAGNECGWAARPNWDKRFQIFATQEEAKAWMLVMYRMEGNTFPKVFVKAMNSMKHYSSK
jgi:hypothetical protein